jgi:hypothetical protein
MSTITYTPLPFSATRPRRQYRPTGLGTRPNFAGWPQAVALLRTAIAAAREAAPSKRGGPTATQIADAVIDRINELSTRDLQILAVVFGVLLRAK